MSKHCQNQCLPNYFFLKPNKHLETGDEVKRKLYTIIVPSNKIKAVTVTRNANKQKTQAT